MSEPLIIASPYMSAFRTLLRDSLPGSTGKHAEGEEAEEGMVQARPKEAQDWACGEAQREGFATMSCMRSVEHAARQFEERAVLRFLRRNHVTGSIGMSASATAAVMRNRTGHFRCRE